MSARSCHSRSFLTAVLIGLLLPVSAAATPIPIEPDAELERLIGAREVVFFARDLDGGRSHVFDRERIDERHPPFSTFKIPNFLIALETGVVADPDALRDWNPIQRAPEDFWPASWKRPQSLVTAFRRSAVWFFRDIALAVGGARYRDDLARFGYGNAAAPDGSDDFWLDGSLEISVREQVRFLSGLLAGDFAVAAGSMQALRAASRLQVEGGCRLHGKTGAGPVGDDFDGPFEGWLVGWVRCADGATTVYALWTRGASFAAIRDFRRDAAVALLERTGGLTQRRSES